MGSLFSAELIRRGTECSNCMHGVQGIYGKLEKQKISFSFVGGRQDLKLRALQIGMPRDFATRTEQPITERAFGYLNVFKFQGSNIFLYEKSRAIGKRAVYFQGFGYSCLHHHSRPLLKYLSGKKIPAFIQCQSLTARIVGAIYLMPPLFEH